MAPSISVNTSLPIDAVIVEMTSQTLTNDTLDIVVRDLITAHHEGLYTETEVRNAVLALMWKQDIHVQAVNQYGVPASEREEIIGQVTFDMARLFKAEDGSGFDLSRALDHSTCAFVRARARNTAMSKMRDARRAEARDGTPTDTTSIAFSAAAAYEVDMFASTVEIDRQYQAVEDFSTIAQNVRGLSRVRVGAQHAYDMYGVALAVRPFATTERDAVYALISADTGLAYRSLRAFYTIVVDSESPSGPAIPDSVLRLWDDMDVQMLETLLDVNPAFAHAIAVDAVGPWARPSQRNIQRFRAHLASLRKGDLEWRSLTAALTAAFIDHEFQAVSDFVTVTEEKREALRKGHTISRSRFENLLGRVAAYRDHPLGTTSIEVHRALLAHAAENLGSVELTRFAGQCADQVA
ncbi:hypothetical protein [Nocardioides sp. Leaf285]|uniref:hypothetical protein n=1 Tax=Nocardioides sp. Leaf285 TaxID=1736322 RepID=UPI000703251E|nr:hypothetical protein [Nocardioides sp. Leaf285]KQP63006.1 hypothetical protein ASF47_18515 [Nocardioides sp. Leaf285]